MENSLEKPAFPFLTFVPYMFLYVHPIGVRGAIMDGAKFQAERGIASTRRGIREA